ncbi:toprim domain-containing protein [Nocardia brasiliensis]|uniref:toprim domain-containing protein n=1 Tax=Nocardia brasiliensis TaxID=37326 RepID=UPI001892DD1A|nr:toprim domain-containing protein [Nocardia brasiliensis]MBF6548884.1 toprim domain-containing protein [Nocardia brasiliensis]
MSTPARERTPATAHERASWDRVTAALEKAVGAGRESGSWTKYCCPVHEADGRSHTPSLGVKYLPDAGRTKVECFAECPDTLVLEKVGLQIADLYDEPLRQGVGRPRASARAKRAVPVSRADQAIAAAGLPQVKPSKDYGRQLGRAATIATYPYVRADGRVEGEVTRKHTRHEHGRKKDFYQRRWNSQTGRMEPGGFAAIPFQLQQVLAAVAEGRTVYVAEGEEDVLALARAGVAATCNAAGAGKWRAEHAEWLRGATRVVVIADRDAPGFRHADKVAQSLTGLVGEVRVVAARGGKDFRDHVLAGYELGELEPVPGLDYRTPIPEASVDASAGAAALTAGTAAAPTHSPRTPELDGGSHDMGFFLSDDAPAQHHDDTVDRIGGGFAQLMRVLMTEMMNRALASHQARKAAVEQWQRMEEQRRREHEAQLAAQRKAAETALAKARKQGWDQLSRSQIAAALSEAVSWAPDSEIAERMAGELVFHIRDRWGVNVDIDSGQVSVEDATPQMVAKMAAAERDRAAASRLVTAQDRMVAMVAAEEIDESAKAALYAQIEQWRKSPTPQGLTALGNQLKDAKVGEHTRARIKFVALYLGGPATAPPTVSELGEGSVLASAALRAMSEPLVDPGEEVKNRVDTMLLDYQARLRHGLPTLEVQARLAEAVSVMNPEDRDLARERGKTIRANPAANFKPLWPDHVDRDELAATVRAYAVLAPSVEARIARADGLDPQWAIDQRDRAEAMRARIDKAARSGKGLHRLEKDQLRAVLTDIEAGKVGVPDMLLADDRTTASLDRDRADEIAYQAAAIHRRELEEILATAAAPEGTARSVRADINRVTEEQTRLAAGRISLRDFESGEAEEKLQAALIANGVPEPVRNQVKKHLDISREDSAITGRQARRIQDRWAERREMVQLTRAPKDPAFDSPERRAGLEYNLRNAGLSEDEIRQCLAADAGRATPPSAAVQATPERRQRLTTPGAGVQIQQSHHHSGPGTDLGPER